MFYIIFIGFAPVIFFPTAAMSSKMRPYTRLKNKGREKKDKNVCPKRMGIVDAKKRNENYNSVFWKKHKKSKKVCLAKN